MAADFTEECAKTYQVVGECVSGYLRQCIQCLGDGIHPNSVGFALLIENALRQGLGAWLEDGPGRGPGMEAATIDPRAGSPAGSRSLRR